MKVKIGSEIVITDCDESVKKALMSILVVDNPEYAKKVKYGLWVGNTPAKLHLYKCIGNEFIIPYGFKQYALTLNCPADYVFDILLDDEVDYLSQIKLYPYQETAVNEALQYGQGVIVAPCGSGKTQIGIEIISRLGLKALWLTHTTDLLNQSIDRAKSVLDVDESYYGTITNGKINIGEGITFATIQTMSKIDLSGISGYWDVVVVDECHHCVGTPTQMTMFYSVLSKLCAKYKFGLTATPDRSDGMEKCMYAVLGKKVHEISKSELEEYLCPVKVIWNRIDSDFDCESVLNPDGTISYTKAISAIINDDDRNKQIINDVLNAEGTSLILTERVSHQDTLYQMLSKCISMRVEKLDSAKNKNERRMLIKEFNEGEIDVLIATYALAKEGLDIPTLRNVFFATPQKNATVVRQSAGRVARKSVEKSFGIVYDYIDDFGLFKRWAKLRNGIYRKEGYENV